MRYVDFLPCDNGSTDAMDSCRLAGPFYVKMLRFFNPKLDLAIKEYWSKWRNEPELAQFLIENFK